MKNVEDDVDYLLNFAREIEIQQAPSFDDGCRPPSDFFIHDAGCVKQPNVSCGCRFGRLNSTGAKYLASMKLSPSKKGRSIGDNLSKNTVSHRAARGSSLTGLFLRGGSQLQYGGGSHGEMVADAAAAVSVSAHAHGPGHKKISTGPNPGTYTSAGAEAVNLGESELSQSRLSRPSPAARPRGDG